MLTLLTVLFFQILFFLSCDGYADAFAVGGKFGGVHALEGGDAVGEVAGVGYTEVVLEDVGAFA